MHACSADCCAASCMLFWRRSSVGLWPASSMCSRSTSAAFCASLSAALLSGCSQCCFDPNSLIRCCFWGACHLQGLHVESRTHDWQPWPVVALPDA